MIASLAMRVAALRTSPPVWLFGLVVFIAAWLVFWVQPLTVRTLLPVLGGSPAVWNTAMVFFQSALLAGYALAHVLARHVPAVGQLAVIAVLWLGAALMAPVGDFRLLGDAPGNLPPALWLLGTMAGSLGLAFVAAASLTPLVQTWLARRGAGAASQDPYFLYAASNAGSAGALFAYPFLLEPFIGLDDQARLWSMVLLGLTPLLVILWLGLPRRRSVLSAVPVEADRPTVLPIGRVLALAAVPSALLLGLTRYLTTDVAAVPLLWIAPLVIYLASFVHAFARRSVIPHNILTRLVAPALIGLAVMFLFTRTHLVLGLVHLAVFAVAALYCHGALARLRPPATDLTRFYLLVSVGGLIGGVAVALVAPLLFTNVYEYPIVLALVAALLPRTQSRFRYVQRWCAAAALIVVMAGLSVVFFGHTVSDDVRTPFVVGLCTILVALTAPALLILRARPLLLAAALLLIILVPTALTLHADAYIARERTFFGVYRIVENDSKRSFFHGTTLHGAEWPRADGSVESLTTYFGVGTPYYDVLTAFGRRPSPQVIGVAGLGTGSLACYARPEDEVRIYEIDPAVVRLARAHFAALRNCAPDAAMLVGDARLLLERERVSLDLLALDAFASDAIPVHLLTVEAFQSYLRILAPEGVIAVHISNRHLDLQPVLAALAKRLGLAARIRQYRVPKDVPSPRPSESSDLVVVARAEATLRALELGAGWVPLESPGQVRVWTDDYTSIVPVIRW